MAEQLHKVHLLSQYLEGELSANTRVAVESHLETCAFCRQELYLLRQTIDALEELSLEKTPADFLEKLHRRFEQDAQLGHLEEQRKLRRDLDEQPRPERKAQPLPSLQRFHWSEKVILLVRRLRSLLFFPSRRKLPMYAATAAGLIGSTVLWWSTPERVSFIDSEQSLSGKALPTAPLAVPVPAPLSPSQLSTPAVSEAIRPVNEASLAAEPAVPSPAPAFLEEGLKALTPYVAPHRGSPGHPTRAD